MWMKVRTQAHHLQKAVEVEEGDTPEILQRRVMEQAEWKILPQAINLIAGGRVTVEDGKVRIGKAGKTGGRPMNVLIVGSGGREHAIAYCVAKSPKAEKIYCTPGNAGIAEYAQCEPIGAMEFDKIVAFAKEKAIDLVIVGMDDPLVGGLVDELEAAGIRTFGPRKCSHPGRFQGIFQRSDEKISYPTAAYENFDDPDKAIQYLKAEAKFPISSRRTAWLWAREFSSATPWRRRRKA